MIRVNENFTIGSDRFQWILVEHYTGQDKDGNPKPQTRETYWASLEQCLKAVRDAEAKECQTVEELLSVLQKSYTLNMESVEALTAGDNSK